MTWSCGNVNYTVGVDVSSNQESQIGTLAYWQSLKNQGYGFGIIKATQGTSYTDPYLQSAWTYYNQVFPDAGPWLYHYINWNASGSSQAQHFYNVLKGLANPVVNWTTLQLMIDIEENLGTGTPSMTIVDDFINELAALVGSTGNFWIYTNQDTWVDYLGNPTTWSGLALWLAAIPNGQTWCPTYTFGGWADWGIMQYGQATIEGVTTDLDELNLG